MNTTRDYNGTFKVSGFEELEFTTERDARHAICLATQYAAEQQVMEFRFRRAAERAKEQCV